LANTKITALTEDTAPTGDDLLVTVNDPAGTPANRKLTITNFLKLMVANVTVQTFTANGTYTPTSGMKKCLLIAVGAGAAGGAVTNLDESAGGGGAGGSAIKFVANSVIGSAQTVTIGIGGASGSSGTNTSVGVIVLATGGTVGALTGNTTTIGATANGGVGGVGSNSDLNMVGGAGERGVIFSKSLGNGGRGGTSIFGGGGAGSPTETAGCACGLYGGGGGGGSSSAGTDRAGGAGANGVVYILEFV